METMMVVNTTMWIVDWCSAFISTFLLVCLPDLHKVEHLKLHYPEFLAARVLHAS